MLTRLFRGDAAGQKVQSDQPVDAGGDTTVVPSGSEVEGDGSGWQPGDIILERYKVEEVFAGAMGKVYISTHLGWDVKMAIKSPRWEVLEDEEGIRRIIREADGWVRLGLHPNIASCYYVLSIDKIPHIFIEYVNGGTLEEWIREGRCKDMRTALTLAVQFCNGMEYTHSQGIIHRDIKPQNILITRDGLVKISDFGILRAINEAEPADSEKTPGKNLHHDATVGFCGTPNYASPEQLRETHHVDKRSDIYSFGLCLWRIFCGKRPYKKNTEKNCPDPTPADSSTVLSPALKSILKKSVAFNPNDRFQNFSELKEALNDVYLDLFDVSCPYAIMEPMDVKAENINNRAVSLAELGKVHQAATLLAQTLEVNDGLPEAQFNLLTLKWRKSKENPERILRRIETAKKRFADLTLFNELEEEIRNYLGGNGKIKRSVGRKGLRLRLCLSKTPMEIFREAQLRRSVQNNIITLLQRRNFSECYQTLMKSWKHEAFKKEKFYFRIYEQLRPQGRKKEVRSAQRMTVHDGNKGGAELLAVVPGRKTIYTAASSDCRLVGRQIGARKGVEKFTRLPANISGLASGPKGNKLAIALDDGSIVVYSFKNETQSLLYSGSPKSAQAGTIVFSPDSRFILAGYNNGRVKIMDSESRDVQQVTVAEESAIHCLGVLGGSRFVAGCGDGTLRFADWKKEEVQQTVEAHGEPVSSLAVAPGGQWIITSSGDRLVKVWNLDGSCKKTLPEHEELITAVLILADERTIITGCDDDTIRLWDLQTGECGNVLDARGDGVCSLTHGPSAHKFLSGCKDGSIIMWTVIYELEFDNKGVITP